MGDDRPPSVALGALLRGFRLAAGLSQGELAAAAGLSVKSVSALEQGQRRRPYQHTLRALASALELSADERARLIAAAHGPFTDASAPAADRDVIDALADLRLRVAAIEETLEGLRPQHCSAVSQPPEGPAGSQPDLRPEIVASDGG